MQLELERREALHRAVAHGEEAILERAQVERLERNLPSTHSADELEELAPSFVRVLLTNDEYSLMFEQPANRAALIETSTNLVDWMRWDRPGNLVSFPSQNEMRMFTGTIDGPQRFFRIRFWSP